MTHTPITRDCASLAVASAFVLFAMASGTCGDELQQPSELKVAHQTTLHGDAPEEVSVPTHARRVPNTAVSSEPVPVYRSSTAEGGAPSAGYVEGGHCEHSQWQGYRGNVYPNHPRFLTRIEYNWRTHHKPRLQASHWGYPEYFTERPFGSVNSQVGMSMIAGGLRDQMILYEYDFDFDDHADELKPRGMHQLSKIVERMPLAGVPIVIQQTADESLDEARRQNVLSALADSGLEIDPEMVIVGKVDVRALESWEAVPTFGHVVEQTRVRGNVGITTSGLRDVGVGGTAGAPTPVSGLGGLTQP